MCSQISSAAGNWSATALMAPSTLNCSSSHMAAGSFQQLTLGFAPRAGCSATDGCGLALLQTWQNGVYCIGTANSVLVGRWPDRSTLLCSNSSPQAKVHPRSRESCRSPLHVFKGAHTSPDHRWQDHLVAGGFTLRSISAEVCVDAFVGTWVAHYGVPQQVTTYRGSQFTSTTWREMCQACNTSHQHSTAYHPLCNRMVERFHRQHNCFKS